MSLDTLENMRWRNASAVTAANTNSSDNIPEQTPLRREREGERERDGCNMYAINNFSVYAESGVSNINIIEFFENIFTAGI